MQQATSAMSNKQILQRETSDFLQRATSATSSEGILQRVTNDFLHRATSPTSNERIAQQITSDFLQRVTSHFLQRATSAASNEQVLQRVTSDFATNNEQRVKSYASKKTIKSCLLSLLGSTFTIGKDNCKIHVKPCSGQYFNDKYLNLNRLTLQI